MEYIKCCHIDMYSDYIKLKYTFNLKGIYKVLNMKYNNKVEFEKV
jgi:hypothetical protein